MSKLFRKEINVMTGEEKIIYLTDEEVAELQALEKERLANIPPPPKPTLEELQAKLVDLQKQMASLAGE